MNFRFIRIFQQGAACENPSSIKALFHETDKSLRKKDFIKAAETDGFEFAVRLDKKADMDRVIRE
jgi:hypothetical protein